MHHISEQELTKLADKIMFGEIKVTDSFGRYVPRIRSHELDLEIDLEPYVNTSGFTVNESFSLSYCYELFRTMALRHLTVVNPHNEPVGMITRKDLMGDTVSARIYERFGRDPLMRIQHLQASSIEFADSLSNQPSPIMQSQGEGENPQMPVRHASLVMHSSLLLEPDMSSVLLNSNMSSPKHASFKNESGIPEQSNSPLTELSIGITEEIDHDITPRVYSLHRYPGRQLGSPVQRGSRVIGSIPSPIIDRADDNDMLPTRGTSTPNSFMFRERHKRRKKKKRRYANQSFAERGQQDNAGPMMPPPSKSFTQSQRSRTSHDTVNFRDHEQENSDDAEDAIFAKRFGLKPKPPETDSKQQPRRESF
jgi:hypothetical protein